MSLSEEIREIAVWLTKERVFWRNEGYAEVEEYLGNADCLLAIADAIARLEALEKANIVQVAGVPDKNFVGACYIGSSNTTLAFRYDDGHKVLSEYDAVGKELYSVLASDSPKPAHWKPALRFFGMR